MAALLPEPSKEVRLATCIKHLLDPLQIPGNGIKIKAHFFIGFSGSGVAGVTASFNHHESETALFDYSDAGINECSTDAPALLV